MFASKKKMKAITLVLSAMLILTACGTKKEEHLPKVYSTENGAIGGYDPVAFFTEQQPVMGNKDLTFSWNDAIWSFSSQANLEAFKASPEKFAPQYGGYCAYGTADGHLSPTQPETWTIVNDRLYFNYNMKVKEKWMGGQAGYIEQADKNWPGLSGQ